MDESLGIRRKRNTLRPILGTALASFLLGAAVVGYVAYKAERTEQAPAKTVAKLSADSALPKASPTPLPSATASEAAKAVARVAEQQGGLDQRLAAAEQRLARLDLQTQAATGNAARSEGLLIAFAARRALEKGADLGYLADQLRLRFGDALPNAVNTIIAASRDPITLDQLIARLEGLSPKLTATTDKPAFERFGDELSRLFVIRRESAPSPQPQRRLERARLFLESGRVEAAIAEVQQMPGADKAAGWIKDAQRYAAAQQALDLIETAAVLEPRRLRDGTGRTVEQPSPAQDQNSAASTVR